MNDRVLTLFCVCFSLGWKTFRVYRAGFQGPHVMLLHGGGYTSMTWCLVAVYDKDVKAVKSG